MSLLGGRGRLSFWAGTGPGRRIVAFDMARPRRLLFCTKVGRQEAVAVIRFFQGKAGFLQQPFHDPVKSGVLFLDMYLHIAGGLLPGLPAGLGDDLLKIRPVILPDGEDHVPQVKPPPGLKQAMDSLQSNELPEIGQVVQRQLGDGHIYRFAPVEVS